MRSALRLAIVLAVAAFGASPLAARGPRSLDNIEFFGYKGLDVSAVRAGLPFREGNSFPPPKIAANELKRQVGQAVKQVTGRDPTDVAFVCCDAKQNWTAYIGLAGSSYQPIAFNAFPTGEVQFQKDALKLADEADNAVTKAVMGGRSAEDDSEGYSLTNDPKARKAQLAIRDFALQHEELVFQVLASSSNSQHRAIAAQMAGYGRQSDRQTDALVHASLDADDEVRNNAVRALWVLAGAKSAVARKIPVEPFIHLMRSGRWSDHNKASLVLEALTRMRDPQVLSQLRADALDPLLEMGRWHNSGHADSALMILGRMAGIDEATLEHLIDAGQTATILSKFDR